MQNDSVVCQFTEQEALLADAVAKVGFGELLNVVHVQEQVTREQRVVKQTYNMIVALRKIGVLNRITIHNGMPTVAEYSIPIHGITAIKKVKFQ